MTFKGLHGVICQKTELFNIIFFLSPPTTTYTATSTSTPTTTTTTTTMNITVISKYNYPNLK
jgi:hypothetical protein